MTPTKSQKEILDSLKKLKSATCRMIAEDIGKPTESVNTLMLMMFKYTNFVKRKKVMHYPGGTGFGQFHYEYSLPIDFEQVTK